MRSKYLSIVISVVAISIVAVSYHIQLKELFITQSKELINTELKIQSELVIDKFKYNLDQLQKQFIIIGQSEGYERMSKPKAGDQAESSQLIDSPFLGMALLTPDPTWTPMWVSLNSKVHDKWSKVFLTQLWGQLPYSRLDENVFWYKVPNKTTGFFWAIIQKVKLPTTELPSKNSNSTESKQAILVGFLPQTALADFSSDFEATSNEIYIVDNYNNTLYFSDLNYLGEKLPEYKFFEDLKINSIETFKNSQGQTLLGTKKSIPESNLYLYYGVQAPESMALSHKVLILHVIIWLFVVIGIILFFVFYQNKADKGLSEAKKLFKKWNANKNLQATPQDLKHLGLIENEVKKFKYWVVEQQQELQASHQKLLQEMENLKETSSVQDKNLLQSLKRPIMLSLGSLQVIKQKNKSITQTEEFLQVEQTLRSLKERVDMSVDTQVDSNQSEFFLIEVIHECINTQKDLMSRLGIHLDVHISERLSLTDVKSRWIAVISQTMLELYDWIELSTDKNIQINFNFVQDQPVLSFNLSSCSLNPLDIQTINEGKFSELNNPTWKLIGQSLSRMQLGFNISSHSDRVSVNIYIPSNKIANFALAEQVHELKQTELKTKPTQQQPTEIFKSEGESSSVHTNEDFKNNSANKSIYEITEEDIDLDSFKVIPTKSKVQGEHDSFVSGTEIGQAPLFSDEEMQDIKKQIEEAKRNKS